MHCARFTAEAERMSTGTSKSEDVAPDQRKGVCSLQVAKEILPPTEEFDYLEVLFTSGETIEHETDRWISSAAAKWCTALTW